MQNYSLLVSVLEPQRGKERAGDGCLQRLQGQPHREALGGSHEASHPLSQPPSTQIYAHLRSSILTQRQHGQDTKFDLQSEEATEREKIQTGRNGD